MGKYQDALNVIETISTSASEELVYERAYCLYRLNRFEESLKLVDAVLQPAGQTLQASVDAMVVVDESIRLKFIELKAQIYCKLESFDKCHGLYKDLMAIKDHEFEEELKTNYIASIASSTFSDTLPPLSDSKGASSHEVGHFIRINRSP